MDLFKFLRIKKNSFKTQLDQFVSCKELLDDACIEIENRMKEQACSAVDFLESMKSFAARLNSLENEVVTSKKAYETASIKGEGEDKVKNLIQIYLMKKEHLETMHEQMKILEERKAKIENNLKNMNIKKMKIEAKAALLQSDISFIEANKMPSLNCKSLNIDDIFKEAEEIINKKKFRFEAEEEVRKMQHEHTSEEINYDEKVEEIYKNLK